MKPVQIITVFLLISVFQRACAQPMDHPPPMEGGEPDFHTSFPGLAEAAAQMDHRGVILETGATYTLTAFDLMYDHVLLFPDFGERLSNSLIRSSADPPALLFHSFRALGVPAGGYGPPLSGATDDPAQSADPVHLEAVIKSLTEREFLKFRVDDRDQWELLSPEFRALILSIIHEIEKAEGILQTFTGPLKPCQGAGENSSTEEYIRHLIQPWLRKECTDFNTLERPAIADLRKLAFASRIVASAPEELIRKDFEKPAPGFRNCIIWTRMGRVGIFGPGKDTIRGTFCFSVDLGGDDYYQDAVATGGPGGPSISLSVDLGGDDTYDSGEQGIASATMGIGMLMDLNGHDSYVSGGGRIASAFYGTGLLYDREGNDQYRCDSRFALGAAHVGTGLLIDGSGDDHYFSVGHSLGYGGTLGLGLVLDRTGNDRYNPGKRDISFILGSARGRWATFTDGHSMGGGLGLCIDGDGDDHYHAGSFSMGAGYFMGSALFFDLKGDDQYDARSHSQGYAAHYSLGFFSDRGGDDRYNGDADPAEITQLMGSGRDLSFGAFMEGGGDDTYHFGNRSAGIGDLRGIGIFWDNSGEDSYHWHKNSLNPESPSMGQTLNPGSGMTLLPALFRRPEGNGLGIFRDCQGKNFFTH